MQLNFNQVNYDGDLEDADEEQLRSTIEQFEAAQEENAAEFEAAKETIEEVDDVDVEDFRDAQSDLVESIKEYDAFEESPLVDEDDLEAASFSKLREWDAHFAELAEEDTDEDEDSEFDDTGTRSPEDDTEPGDEFADEVVGGIAGVNL